MSCLQHTEATVIGEKLQPQLLPCLDSRYQQFTELVTLLHFLNILIFRQSSFTNDTLFFVCSFKNYVDFVLLMNLYNSDCKR